MSSRRIVFVFIALSMMVVSSASAYDTKVDRLYKIDKKTVDVLKKKKMPVTKLLREHFAGQPISAIERFAKANKLDPAGFVSVVMQAQLVAAKAVTPQIAHMLVTQCNVKGSAVLTGQLAAPLQQCAARNAARYGINPTPSVEDVQSWIDQTKALGNATTTMGWSNKVIINRFYLKDAKVEKALKKKKWNDNLAVYENLKISGARDKFAKRNKLDAEAVARYVAYADLLRLKAVHPTMAHLLYLANIRSVDLLKGQPAANLHAQLDKVNQQHKVIPKAPPIDFVEKLVNDAKAFK